MSIYFNDDNSLIVNSELSECCSFTNNTSEAYINISNCIYKYNNNNLYLSNGLILNNNINYLNSNIIPYNNNTNNIYGGWNNIYTSNIYTNNLSITNKIYLELTLSGITLYPNSSDPVPFHPINNIQSLYWNNYNFIPKIKGIYAINYSWTSQSTNSIAKIIINTNDYCISNKSSGTTELINLMNINDKLSFYFNGNLPLKSSDDLSQCISKATITLIRHID